MDTGFNPLRPSLAGDWPLEDIYARFPPQVALELSSFDWPLREVGDFKRLLACTYAAPSIIVGCEFTGEVRDASIAYWATTATPKVAISVDLRLCLKPGPHAVLDLRDVALLKVWDDGYFFPLCTHQVISDTTARKAKMDDGRAFWGIAFFIFCYCIPALRLMVEQPNTIIPDFYIQPSQTLRPCDVGDSDGKPINFYCRGRAPVAVLAEPVEARSGHKRLRDFENAEERDRWRSSWARFPRLAAAVVRVADLPPAEPLVYAQEMERFAGAWHDAGLPVPAGYLAPDARPPDDDSRAYQNVRGVGDGRRVDRVVPASRRSQLALHNALNTPQRLAESFTVDALQQLQQATDCIFLVFVCMQMVPLVYCHVNGLTVLGAQLQLTAGQRLRVAAAAAETMLEGAGRITYLAGRFHQGRGASLYVAPTSYNPPSGVVVRSAAERRRRARSGFNFLWLTLGALAGTQVSEVARRATWATQALRTEVGAFSEMAAPGRDGTFRFGVSAVTSIVDRPADLRQAPSSANSVLERGIREGGLLRDLLLEQADDYLGDWAAQMEPPNMAELPSGLLDRLPSFDDSRFDDLPFAPVAKPNRLPKLPRMPRQRPLPPEAPSCIRSPQELMPAHVWRRVHRWLNQTLYDLICIRDYGDECERSRPRVLVVGPGDLHPWARSHVFDFRASPAQCATLLDTHEVLQHTLNVDFYRERLKDYPNQRILSFIEEGVRYRADVELQTVLVPHLLSLSKGFASVVKELKRMSSQELRWYTHHANFPFWPMYSLGEGAVPRKLEDRWRRCEEGGGPRQETFDSCGLRAWSINEAAKAWHMPQHYHQDERAEWQDFLRSRGLPAEQATIDALAFNRGTKWERQAMPDLSMVMRNLIVLKRAAYLMGEPVYVFGDDVKDYFNHLLNAAEEQWKVNTIFLNDGDVEASTVSAPGGSLTFIAQRRMGFGLHPNSIIAQEHSEAFNYIFRRAADAQEDPILEADPRPSAQRWLEVRRRLAERTGEHESRLYFVLMYCDDNIVAVVGAARALRLLRLWKQLTQEAGLIMAIAAKRTLGVWCVWVGAIVMAGVGLIAIPKQKLIRASDAIRRLLTDGITFEEYRSLTGLLEHLRCIARVPRRLMAGLYHPHSSEGESAEGPATVVRATILMAIKFKQWLDLLARCGGCAITDVLSRSDLSGGALASFVASSDAATDSTPPGIGGFMHGYYWYIQLSQQIVEWLHITLLELLGAAFSVAIFVPMLPPSARLLQQTDASSAYAVLAHDGGHSEMLAMANELLTSTPAVARAFERAEISHVAGDGNGAGDAVSRSHRERLQELATQLRVRLIQVEVPQYCHDILRRLLEHAQQRGVRVRSSSYRPPSPSLPVAAIRLLEDFEEMRGERWTTNDMADGPAGLPAAATAAAPPPFVPLAEAIGGRASTGPAAAQSKAAGKRRLEASGSFIPLAAAVGKRRQSAPDRAAGNPSVASSSMEPFEPAIPPRLQRQRMVTVSVGGVPLAASSVPRALASSERLADLREGLARRAKDMADLGATSEQVERLHAALLHAAEMAQIGAAEKTLEKDDRAWAFWRRFCAIYGFEPIVSRELAVNRPDELASRLGIFTLWVYPQIRGRRTPDALPRTVLNNYAGAVARILKRDYRLPTPRQATYEQETKGLLRSYKQIYGTLALAPSRRQPMTRLMWAKVEALTAGQSLAGRQPWLANQHDDRTLLRLGRFLWKTGHRLGEIVVLSSVEISYLTREHVTFRIGGVPRRNPTPQELHSMRPGDLVLVAPCSSKADQFGEEHCPFPSVIEYDGTSTCAAAALRDIELERPCSGAARASTPLFARADGQPYTYGQLNGMLHSLIAALFGEQIAKVISWHSFRIGLACALRAAHCPDALIQFICRWKCAESLRVYAQLDVSEQVTWLRKAASVNFDAMRTANIPQLDNAEALAELAQPTAAAPARAVAQQAEARGVTTPATIPPPLLTAGDRVRVKWGERWFHGTFTSSRRGLGYDGQLTRIYRIWYDGASGWRPQSKWHDLANEEWQRS